MKQDSIAVHMQNSPLAMTLSQQLLHSRLAARFQRACNDLSHQSLGYRSRV